MHAPRSWTPLERTLPPWRPKPRCVIGCNHPSPGAPYPPHIPTPLPTHTRPPPRAPVLPLPHPLPSLPVCPQAGFVCAVVLWTIIGSFPLLRRLDVAMKRTRALLLLLPDEVILGVGAIKAHFVSYSRSIGVM
jgi:hypothetical protein